MSDDLKPLSAAMGIPVVKAEEFIQELQEDVEQADMMLPPIPDDERIAAGLNPIATDSELGAHLLEMAKRIGERFGHAPGTGKSDILDIDKEAKQEIQDLRRDEILKKALEGEKILYGVLTDAKEVYVSQVWRTTTNRRALLDAPESHVLKDPDVLFDKLKKANPAPEGFTYVWKKDTYYWDEESQSNIKGVEVQLLRYPLLIAEFVGTEPKRRRLGCDENGQDIWEDPPEDPYQVTAEHLLSMTKVHKSILLLCSCWSKEERRFKDLVRRTPGFKLCQRWSSGSSFERVLYSAKRAKKDKTNIDRMQRGEDIKMEREADRMEKSGKVRVQHLGSFVEHLQSLVSSSLGCSIDRFHRLGYPLREGYAKRMFILMDALKKMNPQRKTPVYRKDGSKPRYHGPWKRLILECEPMLEQMRKNKSWDGKLARWAAKEMKETGGRDKWHAIIDAKHTKKVRDKLRDLAGLDVRDRIVDD